MKQRLSILFILILIGINGITFFDEQSKKSLQGKISFAMDYYRERAWFYYRRFTGQIPPDLVVKNFREWSQFSPVCDALVLNNSQSLDWFKFYLDSRDESFKKITVQGENGQKFQSPQSSAAPPPPHRHFPFEKFQKELVNSFERKITNQLSEQEFALVERILMTWRIDADVELQALRNIALSDRQRVTLRSFAMNLVKARLDTRSQPRFPRPNEISDVPDLKKSVDPVQTAHQVLIEKIKETLSAKQIEKWNGKRDAVQKKIDEEREWDYARRLSYAPPPGKLASPPDSNFNRNRQTMPQYISR